MDALKTTIITAKKYPYSVIDNIYIEYSYEDILPSNKGYSDEDEKYVYKLFKEMINEGIIRKEEGSEIIEKILFI